MSLDAALYHLHHMQDQEDLQFWSSLVENVQGPVLELGCGTGRLFRPILEMGKNAVGLDIDHEALIFLKNSLADRYQDRINVFQASLEAFHLGINFSLIFLACNTLSSLSKSTRIKAYQRVYAHLESDGVFVASFPNPTYLRSLPEQSEIEIDELGIHLTSGNPVQVSSSWQRLENKVIFTWHYDQLFADGKVNRETVINEHHLISLDEYLAELEEKKLSPIKIHGDYDRSDYKRNSRYVILIARKKARF
jgi:SAM-dependent methyltransferase